MNFSSMYSIESSICQLSNFCLFDTRNFKYELFNRSLNNDNTPKSNFQPILPQDSIPRKFNKPSLGICKLEIVDRIAINNTCWTKHFQDFFYYFYFHKLINHEHYRFENKDCRSYLNCHESHKY